MKEILKIYNQHIRKSGLPHITNQSGKKYCGYYVNSYGEQWIFTYDYETKIAEITGGDVGWKVFNVVDGIVSGDLLLGKDEQAWLKLCWNAAV